MNEDILQIQDLSKAYSRQVVNIDGVETNERYNIIFDLDLDIPQNTITALIGGNGAGKTTLFNIISGITEADSGSIMYCTKNQNSWISLLNQPPHRMKKIGIGRLFQDNHIFLQMSVLENMMIADSNEWGEMPFVSLFNRKKNREIEQFRMKKAKDTFELLFGRDNPFWQKRDDLASTLSYGQQRLLGLARLLMGKYRLVLLDEPTSGVNPMLANTICSVIKKMVDEEGITVFLIEHNMKIVEEIADYCSFMSHGKITAFGYPRDVIGDETVRKTYLGM